MRTLRLAALGSCLLTACASDLGRVPAPFAAALARAGTPAMIVLRGDRITAVEAPLPPTRLAAPLQRAADSVVPRGRTERIAEYWGPRGHGFRVVKLYGAQRRSVLVDAAGTVLERSHQIPTGEIRAAARARLDRLRLGTAERVEVVQGAPGEESYRVTYSGGGGATTVVECSLDGEDVRVWRAVSAEILIGAR